MTRIRYWRWLAAAAILNRIAGDELRLAALEAGVEAAQCGGLLGHLHEHLAGWEIGAALRYGDAAERAEAAQVLSLERSFCGAAR